MQERTKKQMIVSAVLAAALTMGLAVSGIAAADNTALAAPADQVSPPTPVPPPPGPPGQGPRAKRHHDPAMKQKLDKFLEENRALRRQLVSKRDAHIALMHAAQPDVALIQQISGELFDLREDLKNKAKAAGLPPRAAMAGLYGDDHGPRHHGPGPCCQGMKHRHGHGHAHGEHK